MHIREHSSVTDRLSKIKNDLEKSNKIGDTSSFDMESLTRHVERTPRHPIISKK